MKKERFKRGYLICVLVLLLMPLVAMTVAPTTETTEKKELTKLPGLREDGRWNVNLLSDLGAYFEDHFSFRQEMVSANAKLRSALLQTSATEKVIDGTDGWLYYNGTLDDYQGTNLLSERSLFNIAHNLSMMQGMTEAMGSQFWYTIAPNKNTLYDENMPYYYQAGETSNMDQLIPYLEEEGVHYIDLRSAFEEQDEVLYLKRDSHWNNIGAVLAYNTMLDAMQKEHNDYSTIPYEVREDYIGDLNEMLFPVDSEPELNYYYLCSQKYKYTGEGEDVEDDVIEAYNPSGTGSLLMYRDSFGNTLFPLMANEFKNTYFTKLLPYSLSDVAAYHPDYVVVERVERRIASIIEKPPIMQGASGQLVSEQTVETDTTIHTREVGGYLIIEGEIDPDYLGVTDRIYVSVYPTGHPDGRAYEAFGVLTDPDNQKENCDCGYQLYLMEKNIPKDTDYDIEIITVGENGSYTVGRKTIENNRGE